MALEEEEVEAVLKKEQDSNKLLKPSAQRRPSVKFVEGDVDIAANDSASNSDIDPAFKHLDINETCDEKITTENDEKPPPPPPPFGTTPINVENERCALIRTAARLDQWMKAHPTSVSQDEVS